MTDPDQRKSETHREPTSLTAAEPANAMEDHEGNVAGDPAAGDPADDDKVDVYYPEDIGDQGFLHFFYKFFLAMGAAGTLIAYLIGSTLQGRSFLLGFLSMVILLANKHFTLSFTLKPKHTTWWWESLVAIFQYVLLGLLFYGMISLFAVRWLWYIAGIALIVPGLLGALVFFKSPEPN